MIYDESPDLGIPHLDLPLNEIKALASRMESKPDATEQAAIARTVRDQASWPGGLGVSPHRVAETLELEGIRVSAEQVAWVLLQATR